MDKIAVLIPCYNESATIAKVVQDYRAALPDAAIYVYDNNSTDGTDEIARAAGAVVRYERRQGKGNVIRTMFREIDAECYLMIDGDDTYPAEDARAMADGVLRDGYDMVIGDRLSSTYFTENKRPFHNSGNVLVRKLVNRFFGGHVTDIMTGYRAFSPLFVKSFPILSKGFEIETEMTIHALDKNFALTSIPVGYRDRPAGSESKLNTFSDGFKVLRTIARLYKDYRPLPFFSIIAGILMVAALLWRWLFNGDLGLFNMILKFLGHNPIYVVENKNSAIIALIFVLTWRLVGYAMIMILAGLKSLDPTLIEAAKVDGASPWQMLWQLLLSIIVLTVSNFTNNTVPKVLTSGGPNDATNVITLFQYNLGFRYYQFGTSAALSILIMLITSLIIVLYIKVSNYKI